MPLMFLAPLLMGAGAGAGVGAGAASGAGLGTVAAGGAGAGGAGAAGTGSLGAALGGKSAAAAGAKAAPGAPGLGSTLGVVGSALGGIARTGLGLGMASGAFGPEAQLASQIALSTVPGGSMIGSTVGAAGEAAKPPTPGDTLPFGAEEDAKPDALAELTQFPAGGMGYGNQSAPDNVFRSKRRTNSGGLMSDYFSSRGYV